MGVLRRWCYYRDDREYCTPYSSWDSWGRWVAFAVIVGAAFIIFFLFACFNARRRRTHGLRPHPGTAWMAGPPPQYTPNAQGPYNDPYYQHPPPPQYSPPNPQMYGYFGGQQPPHPQSGIELQQPPNAYQAAGDRVYEPPAGPPPAAKV